MSESGPDRRGGAAGDAGGIDPAGRETPNDGRPTDLVREALEQARRTAAAQGKQVGLGRSGNVRRTGDGTGRGLPAVRRGGRRGWSGARPDARDPQSFSSLISRVAKQKGWESKVSGGVVLGRWAEVVGPDIAGHATPTGLRDGVLFVSASSTAWATQLRMVQRDIIKKIAAAVGPDIVRSLRITGPTAPSWRKGERHISGRGPRDTYG